MCFRKQKTAYELRIRYWSSDVCSSGLPRLLAAVHRGGGLGGRRSDRQLRQGRAGARLAGDDRLVGQGSDAAHRARTRPLRHDEQPPARPRIRPGEVRRAARQARRGDRKEHTSELQSLMRISYAVFCLNTKKTTTKHKTRQTK